MSFAAYPLLGSDVARIMNSAANRLRGSSFLPFLIAARRKARRVASAASGVFRRTIRRRGSAACPRPSAARGGELQRVPAQPHDKVGLPARFGQEAFQSRHSGVIAIADADFARQRRTAFKALGAVFVGPFKMREPAASKVEYPVDAPIGALAARFADAGAVRQTQRAAGQRRWAPGAFAASSRPTRAARKATACFNR